MTIRVTSAWLSHQGVHLQSHDRTVRTVASWPRADPASMVDRADQALLLAGWGRIGEWVFCQIKSDGMIADIRIIRSRPYAVPTE